MFGLFVLWNGGVVLGDKANHVAHSPSADALHLALHLLFLFSNHSTPNALVPQPKPHLQAVGGASTPLGLSRLHLPGPAGGPLQHHRPSFHSCRQPPLRLLRVPSTSSPSRNQVPCGTGLCGLRMAGTWDRVSAQRTRSAIKPRDSTKATDSLQPGVARNLSGVPRHRASRRATILYPPLGYMEAGGCTIQYLDAEEKVGRRLHRLVEDAEGRFVVRDRVALVGERSYHVRVLILGL